MLTVKEDTNDSYIRMAISVVLLFCSLMGNAQSKQSNELFAKGVAFYEQGKYQKAIAVFQEMNILDFQQLDSTSNRRDYGNMWIASCLYKLGRKDEAEQLDQMHFFLLPPVDRRLTLESDSIAALAVQMRIQGDFEKSIKYYQQCAEIEKRVLGEHSMWYANTLCSQGEIYLMQQQLDKSIACLEQGLAIIKSALGSNLRYYLHLRLLSFCLSQKGDFSEVAFSLVKEAAKLSMKYDDTDNVYDLLDIHYRYCIQTKRYADAIPLLEEAKDYYREKQDTIKERIILQTLSQIYFKHIEDYDRATQNAEELLSCAEWVDSVVLGTHFVLQEIYAATGNKQKEMEQWQSIAELSKGNENYQTFYIRAMIELAGYYSDQRSLSIMQQLVDYFSKNPPITDNDSSLYINVCHQQSELLSFMGKQEEAYEWMSKAVDLEEMHSGSNSCKYFHRLFGLMRKEFELKGTEAGQEIIDKYLFVDDVLAEKLSRGEMDRKHLKGVNPIAFYRAVSGYYFMMEALYDYQRIVRNVPDFYFHTKSLDSFRQLLLDEYGGSHPVYENLNASLCMSYMSKGMFKNALECLQHMNSGVYKALKTMAYMGLNDMDQAYYYAKEYLQGERNDVLTKFKWMTSEERNSYWSKQRDDIADFSKLSTCVSDFRMAPLLYDMQLFSKGLLLNAELELNRLLEAKGDNSALQLLKEWREIKVSADRISQSEEYYDAHLLQELNQKASLLERQLTLSSEDFGDFTKDLSISYKDVQHILGKDDVAVEFATYKDTDGSIHYYALLLSPDTIHLVGLSTESELRHAIPSSYASENLFDLIWKPLTSYFSKNGRVFFAAEGLLHQVPVESIKGTEKYHFCRLSSTRELVKKTHYSAKDAVLYGGINYSLTQEKREFGTSLRSARGAIGEIRYLPGSLNEINSIKESIKPYMNVISLTDVRGSEESFKALSGQRKSIIHISTHGFYNQSAAQKQQSTTPFDNNLSEQSKEDISLSYSGLLMAGAEDGFAALETEVPQDGAEDGILTAKEISRLDLRGLELVALSACESGLGDITGDGVFGLQRGFKKAGANSILMSLWTVDDEATCLLMTEFYKHWIGEKMTKYDALEKAKQTVRSHTEKGWDDPKYWAAFILLDALD